MLRYKTDMKFSKQTRTFLKAFEFKGYGFCAMARTSHTVTGSAVQEPWKTLNSTMGNDPVHTTLWSQATH